jgi:adenylate cyclase
MKAQFASVCRVCNTVLKGPLGYLFHLFGIRRSSHNPNVCNRCDAHLQEGTTVEVTVLFADLTGFTRLTSELGAERSYEVINEFFTMTNEVLIRHDAYIDKYIGDAVMAFFNVPIQSPHHARQAVQAALAIQQGMAGVSASTGISLQSRIGVASGYARMGRLGSTTSETFTVIGDVVNLAARLEALARPGEVLVDATTFMAADGNSAGTLPETLDIRGFPEPVRAFRLNQDKDSSAPLLEPSSLPPVAARQSIGVGSILFTIFGAPCALSPALSPLALVLGLGTAAGASGTFVYMLDAAQIRIPMQLFGVGGALINLYVARHALLRHKVVQAGSMTSLERRKLLIVVALSVFALLAVALETYHHLVVKGLSYFEPLL